MQCQGNQSLCHICVCAYLHIIYTKNILTLGHRRSSREHGVFPSHMCVCIFTHNIHTKTYWHLAMKQLQGTWVLLFRKPLSSGLLLPRLRLHPLLPSVHRATGRYCALRWAHTCIHTYTDAYTRARLYVLVYTHVYSVDTHAYIYIYIYIYTHTHTHTHMYIFKHVQTSEETAYNIIASKSRNVCV